MLQIDVFFWWEQNLLSVTGRRLSHRRPAFRGCAHVPSTVLGLTQTTLRKGHLSHKKGSVLESLPSPRG